MILTRTASNSLFFCINCFSSSTILDMASFSVSKSLSAICHHEKETEWDDAFRLKLEDLNTKKDSNCVNEESVLEKIKRKGWWHLCFHSHVRDSPPVPPHVQGQRFWSLRLLEASPHQTGYPSMPGSALWVYHFQCASASVHKNTISFWVSVKRIHFQHFD